MASSSKLGLRTGELFFTRITAFRRTTLVSAGRGCGFSPARAFTTSQSRQRGGVSRQTLEGASPRISSQHSPQTEMSMRKQANPGEIAAEALSVVMPGTFVLPRASQFPRPLGEKLSLLRYWITVKAQEIVVNGFQSYMSKPSFFSRARFNPKRSTIIPTAKALQRSMAEALATGDKHTINRICSRGFARQLLAAIDARPRGRRYGWELVAYTDKMFYPSLKSHKISPISRERGALLIQQAVVAISSRQRRVEYDAHGQVLPGSEKEVEAVENVVISRVIDPRTWTWTEWQLVGSVKSTTLEEWKRETELLKATMME